jgi:hypothetical protein
VVKDPTYPGPSLVTRCNIPPPPFYNSYRLLSQWRKKECTVSGVFQQEGALVEGEIFDLERGRGFGGQNPLGSDCWALGTLPMPFLRGFLQYMIYLELGTISRGGGCTASERFLHLGCHNTSIQLETLPRGL